MKTATCHSNKPHKAKGLCVNCYARIRRQVPEVKAREAAFNRSEKRKSYKRQYAKSKKVKEYIKTEKRVAYRRAYYKIYNNVRYETDELFRLACILRSRVRSALKNNQKTGSAVRDLGCTLAELKTHIESLFQPGMTWENHGDWHIDHKKPLASFDLTDRIQFLQACHYTNLQPLWAAFNLSKSDKYE